MVEMIAPGSRVKVPLRARLLQGTVLEVLEDSDVPGLKEIHEVMGGQPLILPKLFELARWISDYYCCSLEAAMSCLLPQVVRQAQVSAKMRNFARALREITDDDLEKLAAKAPRQADALNAVQQAGKPTAITELCQTAGVSEGVFRTLEEKGWIAIEQEEVARDPHAGDTFIPTQDLELNEEQARALEAVKVAIASPTPPRPILLYGVTEAARRRFTCNPSRPCSPRAGARWCSCRRFRSRRRRSSGSRRASPPSSRRSQCCTAISPPGNATTSGTRCAAASEDRHRRAQRRLCPAGVARHHHRR